MRASAVMKVVAGKSAPRPLAERGRMMFVADVQALFGKDAAGEWRRSEWWVRTQFAQDRKRYLGRTPYWWEADVLEALDEMGTPDDA